MIGRAIRMISRGLVIAVALGPPLAVCWAVFTTSGAAWATRLALGFLPGSGSVERIEGSLAGGLTLTGLDLEQPGWGLRADQLSLHLDLSAAARRRIVIRSLTGQGIDLQLRPGAEPSAASNATPEVRLPVSVLVGHVSLTDLCIEQGSCIDRSRARGLVSRAGDVLLMAHARSAADQVSLAGALALNTPYATDLRAAVNWVTEAGPLALDAALQGDGESLRLRAHSGGALPARAEGELRTPLTDPHWELTLEVLASDGPTLLPDALRGPASLELTGTRSQLSGAGNMTLAGRPVTLEPVELAWWNWPSLEIRALSLTETDGDGELSLKGSANLTDISVDLEVVGRGRYAVELRPEQMLPLAYQGQGELSGGPDQWRFEGQLEAITRSQEMAPHDTREDSAKGPSKDSSKDLSPGSADQVASLEILAEGDQRGVRLRRLRGTTGAGYINGNGSLRWAPTFGAALDFSASEFNPGYWFPGWPGALSFEAYGDLNRVGADWRGNLNLADIEGELRGYPLRGKLIATFAPGLIRAIGDLSSADTQLTLDARLSQALDARLAVQAPDLSTLIPGLTGSLHGGVTVQGRPSLPRVTGDLVGESLAWQGFSADQLKITGGGEAESWRSAIEVVGLSTPPDLAYPIDNGRVTIRGEGGDERFSGSLHLRSTEVAARLQAGAEIDGDRLLGTINEVELDLPRLGAWSQSTSTPFRLQLEPPARPELELDTLCLDQGAATVCSNLSIAGERAVADFTLTALPLARAFSAAQLDPVTLDRVEGTLDGQGRWQLSQGRFTGEATLSGDRWIWHWLDDKESRSTVNGFRSALALGTDRVTVEVTAEAQGGRLNGRLVLPFDAGAEGFSGNLELRDLPADTLRHLWPQVSDGGRIQSQLSLSGSRRVPRVDGRASVDRLTLQFPAQGIAPELSGVTVEGDGERLRLAFDARSGEGNLRGEGTLRLTSEGPIGELRLNGHSFEVMRTAAARLSASPEVTASINQRRIDVSGRVVLPGGSVDLSGVAVGVSPSPDVVVSQVGEDPGVDPWPWRTTADVALEINPPLTLTAPGFSGDVSGTLRMVDAVDADPVGIGELTLTGSYQAYGQDLTLERGLLRFSGSPLTNPTLDFKAVRDAGEVSAGLLVTGTLRRPSGQLWSNPAMDDAQALSYLLTGRPLKAVTSGSGRGFSEAAQALAVSGGNALSAPVARALGVDELRVESTEGLEQATLLVGKYLTPDLYVAYGVGLIDPINVVRITYELSDHWRLEAESGNESRTALRYRVEKD